MRRMRDAQRTKVYRWEQGLRRVWDTSDVSEAELRKLAQLVWDRYVPTGQSRQVRNVGDRMVFRDCPRITVTRRKSTFSSYYPMTHEIKLAASWGARKTVLLHEMAHAVIGEFYANEQTPLQPHGPQFMELLMRLFNDHLGISMDVQKKAAALCGCRYTWSLDRERLFKEAATTHE